MKNMVKSIILFSLAVFMIPFWIFMVAPITALIEWLEERPNWKYYRSYHKGYLDALMMRRYK